MEELGKSVFHSRSYRSHSMTSAYQSPGSGRWNRAACIAMFLILLLVTLQSARLGVAGLIVELGQQEVDRWALSKRPYGISDLSRIAGIFNDGLDLVADHPWALESLGALDLARMRLSGNPRAAKAYTQDARIRFRQALHQRPASPFLWANLALSKLYLDEVDDEFLDALRYANELGPWEPAAQQTVLFAGLAAWEKLDAGMRQEMTGVLERGTFRNAEKLYAIAKSFRRFDLVCGISSYDLISGVDCRSAGSAPQAGRSTNNKGNR